MSYFYGVNFNWAMSKRLSTTGDYRALVGYIPFTKDRIVKRKAVGVGGDGLWHLKNGDTISDEETT